MKISLREVLLSSGSVITFVVILLVLIVTWAYWRSYVSGFSKEKPHTVNIANLLQVIGLAVTAVSILLPAGAALVVYYLSSVQENLAKTAIPLFLSLFLFACSLVVGLWNAFSFVTQFEGGEKATWDEKHVFYPVFFVFQFVLLVAGIFWLLWLFLGGIPVGGLVKKEPNHAQIHKNVERMEQHVISRSISKSDQEEFAGRRE